MHMYECYCLAHLLFVFNFFSSSFGWNTRNIQSMWKIYIENWAQLNLFNIIRLLLCRSENTRVCLRNFGLSFTQNVRAMREERLIWNDCTRNWKNYMVKFILRGNLLKQNKHTHTQRSNNKIEWKLNLIHAKIMSNKQQRKKSKYEENGKEKWSKKKSK